MGRAVGPYLFGVILAFLGWLHLLQRRRERGTLVLYEQGFSWTPGAPRSGSVLRFDEIEALAVWEVDWTGDAGAEGLWRRFDARSPAGRIRFRNTARKELPDAVGAFLNELLDRLADATEARMRSGRPLSGED